MNTMKKTYSKPEIMFENFAVSTNIASGCGILTNYAKDQCGYEYTDEWGDKYNIFLIQGACTTTQPEGFDGICYHVAADTSSLFTS